MTPITIYPHEAAMIRKARIHGCIPAQVETGSDIPHWIVSPDAIEKIAEASRRVLDSVNQQPVESTSWAKWLKQNAQYYTAMGEAGELYNLGTDLATLSLELQARKSISDWATTLAHYLTITSQDAKAPWNPSFYKGTYTTEKSLPESIPSSPANPAESVKLFPHEAQILTQAGLMISQGMNDQGEPIFSFFGTPREIEGKAMALESECELRQNGSNLLEQGRFLLLTGAELLTHIADLKTLARQVHARRNIPEIIGKIARYNLITGGRLPTAETASFYKGDYKKVQIIIASPKTALK